MQKLQLFSKNQITPTAGSPKSHGGGWFRCFQPFVLPSLFGLIKSGEPTDKFRGSHQFLREMTYNLTLTLFDSDIAGHS